MDTRDKILKSAVQLFEEKGYHMASIQEISERAGVSKGAVFHYFPTKAELLFALNESIFVESQLKNLNKVLSNEELTPIDKLRELIIFHVEMYAKNRSDVVIFYQEFRHLSGEKLEVIKEKRDMYEEVFRKVIRQGVENGDFRDDLDVNIATKAIFGMCSWTYQWLNPDGPLTPAQIAQIFCNILVDGLRKR